MNTTRIVLTSDTHNLESVGFWKAIDAEAPDVVLHAGDWTMLGFQEAREALDRMRQGYKGPLLTVLGNHDFWEPNREKELPVSLIVRNWELLCQGFDVEILEGTTWTKDNICIGGMSGWYKEKRDQVPTNDPAYVSEENWNHLVENNWVQIERLLDRATFARYDIVFTHFPISTTEAKLLSQVTNRLVLGHWHNPIDAEWMGMRVLNAGSGIHEAKFMVLEL